MLIPSVCLSSRAPKIKLQYKKHTSSCKESTENNNNLMHVRIKAMTKALKYHKPKSCKEDTLTGGVITQI